MPRPDQDLRPAERTPWRLAALLVLPYLVLSLMWAISNPPGAAPDETDHLVKAIGNARGSIGVAAPALPAGSAPILERNNSTTRSFQVPADLNPTGYTCFAFHSRITADCLPDGKPEAAPTATGDVTLSSSLGAYPPFLYVPIGLAALATDSPGPAILASRLVVLAMSSLLLLLGLAHLIRWLGRSSVLGVVALMTPVVVFLDGSLSPSAIELAAATCVAAVVSVALVEPRTVHLPATQWTLGVGGVVLALSRQLGLLALAAFVLVLLAGIGWPHVRRLVTRHQLSFVVPVVAMGLASVLVLWWERTYDRPANVATPFDADAVSPFVASSYDVLASAIGTFGWLDTPMPGPATGLWICLWVLVVSLALLTARRRNAAVIALVVVGTGLLALAVYASAFFPIGAAIQGRHFLPVFSLALVLAGVVLPRNLPPRAMNRLFWGVGVLAAVVQVVGIYANGRRYAVGTKGPVWWVPDARWEPVLGWWPWLGGAVLAAALLGFVVVSYRPTPRRAPASG